MANKLSDKNILIIEDDVIIAQSLVEYFQPANTVQTYRAAELATEALPQQKQIDIFIIDYLLPGMNGIEFFQKVRDQYPKSRFICISGHMDLDLAASAQQFGFDALILKPFDFAILEKNILELVD